MKILMFYVKLNILVNDLYIYLLQILINDHV